MFFFLFLQQQTYYLTMDLSHSGMFEKVKDAFHAQDRGGYRQWFNPVYANPNENTRLRPTKTNAMLFGDQDKDEEDEEDDGDVAPREDDDEPRQPDVDRDAVTRTQEEGREGQDRNGQIDPDSNDRGQHNVIDPSLRPAQTPPQPPSGSAPAPRDLPHKPARIRTVGEIQVLDLHSDNPIVSYKGRIFSGSWASNIGTELMFGDHDELAERNLPYLRALPGGVNLMAASSARILTHPADLRSQKRFDDTTITNATDNHQTTVPVAQQRPSADRYRTLRKAAGIEIPVAFDKHGRRKPQARFLENLMAIKRSRGEMDEATTMTKDTVRNWVDRDEDPEEAVLQKKRARDRKRQLRLMEERLAMPKKRRTGGNRWMRRRVVTFGDRHGQVADSREESATQPQGEGQTQYQGALSTTTPRTWGELGGGGGGGGGEEEEEGEEEEDTTMVGSH